MNRLKTIATKHGNKALVLVDQGLISGTNFLVGVVLARELGIKEFGTFTLAWLTIILTSSLHQALITMPLFSLGPRQKYFSKYISRLHFAQLFFSGLAALLIAMAWAWVPQLRNDIGFLHVGLLLPITAGLYTYHDFLRRISFTKHKSITALIMDVIAYGGQIITIVLLVHLNALSLSNTFIAILSSLFISSLFGLIQLRPGISLNGMSGLIKSHWEFGKYLLATTVLQWFSGNILLIIGAGVIGTFAAGAIRMVQNLMGVLNVIFLALENIVPVRAAELITTKGKHAMLAYVRRTALMFAGPVLLLILIVAIFHSSIIELVYGEAYVSYAWLVIGFCSLYVLVFVGTWMRFIIRTVEKNHIVFRGYVVSTLVTAATAIPLVQNFHLGGILIGFFLSQIVCLSIYSIYLKNEIKCILRLSI